MITQENYNKLKEQLSEIRNHNYLIWRIVKELMKLDYFQLSITERTILRFIYFDICWIWGEE